MTKKEINKDEYKFEEEQDQKTQEYKSSAYKGSTENINSIIKNKRLMMMMAAVVTLWIITFIFDSLYKKDDSKIVEKIEASSLETVKKSLIEEPDVSKASNEEKSDDTSSTILSTAATPSASIVEDEHKMNEVSANVSAHSAEINTIKDDVNNMATAITILTKKLDDLTTQIGSIVADNKTVVNQVNIIEARHAAEVLKKEAATKPKKVLKKVELRAIIEGRAWLVDSDGSSNTIQVGDSLQDYGTVIAIYADKGIVTTSSARIISFPTN